MSTAELNEFDATWGGPHDEEWHRQRSEIIERGDEPIGEVVPFPEDVAPVGPDSRGRQVLPPPSNPMAVARQLVADRFTDGDLTVIRAWRGGFYAWNGLCWPEADEATIRASAYAYLEHAVYEAPDGRRPWEPNRNKVANVLETLRAVTHLDPSTQPPAWLDGEHKHAASDLIVVENGVLHLPSRTLLPHDPRLFVGHSVPFDFAPGAPAPERWLAFLDELWADDPQSIDLLQEMFGYVLSGDTSLQKILMLVGPTRAGKGVIARTLAHLVGQHNVGAPTLAGLASHFGLQDLIGKTLGVISDARLGRGSNVQALAERLLSVSGEDSITIDRKYRDPWTGRLGVRFLMLTNELPRLSDASGALAKRFVVLVLTKSFYDKEDPALLSRLLPEVPGILNWALEGLDRLRAQRFFTRPASAQEAIQDLEDLASPMGAFLRDRCVVTRDSMVSVDDIWTAWKEWCEDQAQSHGSKANFGRELRAAVPGIRMVRPRDDGGRHRAYQGVGLAAIDWSTDRADHQQAGPHGPRPSPLSGELSELAVEDDYPASAWADGDAGRSR